MKTQPLWERLYFNEADYGAARLARPAPGSP
jgi:hypothetical protein